MTKLNYQLGPGPEPIVPQEKTESRTYPRYARLTYKTLVYTRARTPLGILGIVDKLVGYKFAVETFSSKNRRSVRLFRPMIIMRNDVTKNRRGLLRRTRLCVCRL